MMRASGGPVLDRAGNASGQILDLLLLRLHLRRHSCDLVIHLDDRGKRIP